MVKSGDIMLFRGNCHRILDIKARIMLPPNFRNILLGRSQESSFVLTTYDGCLVAYPEPDWNDFEEKISKLQTNSRLVRDFKRLILGGAEEQQMDKQGRILLSKAHLDYAGIERDIVLVGQAQRFEIWAQDRYLEVINQDFSDLTEALSSGGVNLPI